MCHDSPGADLTPIPNRLVSQTADVSEANLHGISWTLLIITHALHQAPPCFNRLLTPNNLETTNLLNVNFKEVTILNWFDGSF